MKRPVVPQVYERGLTNAEKQAVLAKLDQASQYEERVKQSGHALRILLSTGGCFYSIGWRGCTHCGQRVDAPILLQPFAYKRDGLITIGWRCRP